MKLTKKLTTLFSLSIFLATSAFAQEKLSTSDIQNDLLKASLGAKSSNPAIANKTITESDLETANKKLLAAEARLLQKANLSPEAASPLLPRSADDPAPVAIIKERTIEISKPQPAQSAQSPLDINKVIAAIDKTKPEGEGLTAAAANPAPIAPGTGSSDLEQQLAAAVQKNNELIKELDDTRNRLMIAETQVERLSSIIDGGNRNKLSDSQVVDSSAARSVSRSRPAPRPESSESDMQIAVVTADKVHLRTGPGKENSPLMAVTKGTRLAVETRNGEWYRVIAPTGARAWVSNDVISFSTADKIKSGSRNQVVGFNGGSNEDEAF